MNLRGTFYALMGIILLASCGKSDNEATKYNYTFVNNTGKTIYVDIYTSANDYNNNQNIYLHGSAAPNGGTFVLPSTQLHTNAKYYVDWYTQDYTYSNWVNRTDIYASFDPTITPTKEGNITQLQTLQDYARLLCLNGNGTTTKWKAVSGYTFLYSGGSRDSILWSQLSQDRKEFEVQFNKDFSFSYYFIAPNGQRGSVTEFARTTPQGTPNGTTEANLYLYHNASLYDYAGIINTDGTVTYKIAGGAGAADAAVSDTIHVNIDAVGVFDMVRE